MLVNHRGVVKEAWWMPHPTFSLLVYCCDFSWLFTFFYRPIGLRCLLTSRLCQWIGVVHPIQCPLALPLVNCNSKMRWNEPREPITQGHRGQRWRYLGSAGLSRPQVCNFKKLVKNRSKVSRKLVKGQTPPNGGILVHHWLGLIRLPFAKRRGGNTCFLFIRKKFIRKWGSNCQNIKKLVRKSRGSISKIKRFYRRTIDISLLLHSKY